MLARLAIILVGLLAALPAAAQNTGSFVVRLGNDTTSVEHHTRTKNRVTVDQVGRSPRVLQRHFTYDFGDGGGTTKASVTVTLPSAAAGAPAFQQIDAEVKGDSVFVTVKRDTSVQIIHVAVPTGTLIVSNAAPWSLYEGQAMKLAAMPKADSLRVPMYLLGASNLSSVTVSRLGPDSMAIYTQNDRYHARIDKTGRIQGTVPISGTQKYSIARVANLDLAAQSADFVAREKAAGAMGALSTRDTVQAVAGGANLWVDYGRPAKRGRVVYGGVVPYGQLWRTGANAATQFKSDKNLEVGGVAVPAGFYSLWTVPAPDGWKLIINGETGGAGTEHKADKDLYTIPMTVSVLPESVERFTIGIAPAETGGVLNLDWDTTRASVPFTVKP